MGPREGKGKVDERIWFMIKNRKRRQSIIAVSSRCKWKISAARKKIYFSVFVYEWFIGEKKGAVIAALRRSWIFLPSFLQSNASLHPLSHICFFLVILSLFWLCSRVIRIIMIKLVVGFFYSLIFFTLRRQAKLHLLPFMRRKSRKSVTFTAFFYG